MTFRALVQEAIGEAQLDAQVRKLAEITQWARYHTYRSTRSAAGWPDLVLVRAPRLIVAELKSDDGKPSDAQRHWLTVLSGCQGVEVYLWRPRDLDAIARILSPARTTRPDPLDSTAWVWQMMGRGGKG